MTDTAPTALALRTLADGLEKEAAKEWDDVLVRRDPKVMDGHHAGSSYWDGRQAVYREIVRRLRALAEELARTTSAP